jgi:hypothetical protein
MDVSLEKGKSCDAKRKRNSDVTKAGVRDTAKLKRELRRKCMDAQTLLQA